MVYGGLQPKIGSNYMDIPQLKSRYIPVGTLFPKEQDVIWWKKESDFCYPNILINLMTTDRKKLDEFGIDDSVFLLTDSGGFQVISGTCDLDWKSSLIKQIELRATKIFSFDIPPAIRRGDRNAKLQLMNEGETKVAIEKNIETALIQSKFIKENYPLFLGRFCFVAQGISMDTFKYNFELLDKKIGMNNFSQYFPGGLTVSNKSDDIMLYAMASKYIGDNFVKKGIYVHWLGIGSFNRMMVMIRNSIPTFDSSNALRAAINWQVNNPLQVSKTFISSKDDYFFDKGFCICPVCIKKNYIDMLEKSSEVIGRTLVKHNLWCLLQQNIFLDSLKKDKYTRIVKELFDISEDTLNALEFIDEVDKVGFDIAYDKYKHYLNLDKSKQKGLF